MTKYFDLAGYKELKELKKLEKDNNIPFSDENDKKLSGYIISVSDQIHYNSQLQGVWFSGSLLDNVKIKNSILEEIKFDGAKAYKETYINGVLTTNRIPIKDYASFLKEIS